MDFPNNIARISLEKGIKQAELARRMGKLASQVERFWNGKRKLDAIWIQDFANALECPVSDIIITSTSLHLSPEDKEIRQKVQYLLETESANFITMLDSMIATSKKKKKKKADK